jgi:hypothetical protein
MTAFSPDMLRRLQDEHTKLNGDYETLLMAFVNHTFSDAKAHEHATHGFGRRVGTQMRCIKNIFRILPPERSRLPTRDELVDAQINLQSFVLNTFGALDNLAWIWVHEKKVRDKRGQPLSKFDVGLSERRKIVRASLSPKLRDYMVSVDPWLSAMEDYRDSLAHRIPLYIPPYQLTPAKLNEYNALEIQREVALNAGQLELYEQLSVQQEALCTFMPVMKHSFEENSNAMVFHAQMFADFKTIYELGLMLLGEL